jgi:hypothetical protein
MATPTPSAGIGIPAPARRLPTATALRRANVPNGQTHQLLKAHAFSIPERMRAKWVESRDDTAGPEASPAVTPIQPSRQPTGHPARPAWGPASAVDADVSGWRPVESAPASRACTATTRVSEHTTERKVSRRPRLSGPDSRRTCAGHGRPRSQGSDSREYSAASAADDPAAAGYNQERRRQRYLRSSSCHSRKLSNLKHHQRHRTPISLYSRTISVPCILARFCRC